MSGYCQILEFIVSSLYDRLILILLGVQNELSNIIFTPTYVNGSSTSDLEWAHLLVVTWEMCRVDPSNGVVNKHS